MHAIAIDLCAIQKHRSGFTCRETHIPREVLLEYIEELKKVFTPQAYNLFHHNCNNFSNELATFLTGSGIPVRLVSPLQMLSAQACGRVTQGNMPVWIILPC